MCYNTHMRSATVKINAKINLSLNVVGKEDGYHMLDSVAASVDIADVITVYESKSPVAEFSNRDIDAEKSNAFAAAMFLTKKYSRGNGAGRLERGLRRRYSGNKEGVFAEYD